MKHSTNHLVPAMLAVGMHMGPLPKQMPTPGRPISYSAAKPLIRYSDTSGKGSEHANHRAVLFTGRRIHIVMVAVEPGAPDQSFEVHKFVDPEIVTPAGSRITLTLLNMDYGPGMVHGVVIGATKPPYKTAVPLPVAAQFAEIPLTMPRTLRYPGRSHYFVATRTFVAPRRPGLYYYFCQMPGHAKAGMYGRWVVTP